VCLGVAAGIPEWTGGSGEVATYYGGRVRRGTKKERFREASGKIIRVILSQLEQAGYVLKPGKGRKGRVISPRGRSFLDSVAHEIKIEGGKRDGE